MLNHFIFLAQTSSSSSDGGGAFALVINCISLILALIIIAALWRLFAKAGQPGWAAIIPIYNYFIILKIVGRPWWWLLLLFIPFVNFVVAILIYFDLAKAFGKGQGFGCLMLLFPYIFIPLLAFSDARYEGAPN